VLTGTLRWRLPRFTPASIVGSALWSTYVALIGYFGGELTGAPLAGLILSLAIAAVIAVTTTILVKRAHRNRIATGEVGDEPVPVG
ncbi:MAG TPA: DedA family protein, partial [Pseudonocardiaceae bacterium]